MRRSVPILFAIFGLLAAACGGGGTGTPATTVSLTIASFNFAESQILAEIYGQALAADGHTVQYKHKLGSREIVFPALEKGDVELVPEYLATVLAFATKSTSLVQDATAGQSQLRDTLKPKGIAVLDLSPAVDTNAFVVTKATAQKHGLKTMSDLAKVASQLTLGAPPTCPQRPFCLVGLEQTYGIKFKEFKALDTGGPITVAAIESGQVDVGLLFSSSAQIAAKGFVALVDDKHLQAADNVVPVVRQSVLDKAGGSFSTRINDISKKITTEKLIALNGKVEIDKKDPADVAKEFLRSEGLIK